MFFWGGTPITNSGGYSSIPIDDKKILTVKEWIFRKKYSFIGGSSSIAIGHVALLHGNPSVVNGSAVGQAAIIGITPPYPSDSKIQEESVCFKPIPTEHSNAISPEQQRLTSSGY